MLLFSIFHITFLFSSTTLSKIDFPLGIFRCLFWLFDFLSFLGFPIYSSYIINYHNTSKSRIKFLLSMTSCEQKHSGKIENLISIAIRISLLGLGQSPDRIWLQLLQPMFADGWSTNVSSFWERGHGGLATSSSLTLLLSSFICDCRVLSVANEVWFLFGLLIQKPSFRKQLFWQLNWLLFVVAAISSERRHLQCTYVSTSLPTGY